MTDLITARDVSKAYGDLQVLEGINLDVHEGEILGIIGPSGSGKSTLLRLLDLIEPATAGEIMVFGVSARAEPARWLELRRRMGMLFQKPIVFNASVYQNVALGLQYRRLDRAETERRVKAALDAVGLSQYIGSKARDLSGGEQQRVALSRVLVTEPEVLFLDEPTANLDPTSTATIEKIVRRLNREKGTTVVMNTHNLLQGQRLSSRVAVMIDGTVVQTGPPKEVFQAPRSRAIATFVGIENILRGRVLSRGEDPIEREDLTEVEVAGHTILSKTIPPAGTDEVDVLIRGEDIDLLREAPAGPPLRNRLPGRITGIESIGPYVRMVVDCTGFSLTVGMTARLAAEREFDMDMEALVAFRPRVVHLLPAATLQ
jgi:tungstate transport system ATP-binding protein